MPFFYRFDGYHRRCHLYDRVGKASKNLFEVCEGAGNERHDGR